MKPFLLSGLLALLLAPAAAAQPGAKGPTPQEVEFFENRVRPAKGTAQAV